MKGPCPGSATLKLFGLHRTIHPPHSPANTLGDTHEDEDAVLAITKIQSDVWWQGKPAGERKVLSLCSSCWLDRRSR